MQTKNNFLLFGFFIALQFSCHKSNSQPAVAKQYNWQEFVMGADLSYINQIEDAGGVYKMDGKVTDPFVIFKSIGTNTVRVRLWHNPVWKKALANGKMYSDLYDVEKTIRRAKEQGMAVNLDLHYSDTWCDPGNQTTPAAWAGLSLPVLKDSVYNYTLAVLNYLKAKNLTPEMIQVGNENNGGILWPVGKVENNDSQNFAALLNSGIKAVRDFSATSAIKPQIILHVAQLMTAEYWMDQLIGKGVTDFDIMGLSHYYKWSTVNDMTEFGQKIALFKSKFKKKIMIVETAFPWTNQNADSYNNILYTADAAIGRYPVSTEGQQQYLKELTQQLFSNGGSGLMYWEPGWITSPMKDLWGTGSSWENATYFDFSGNLLPGNNFMRQQYK